MYYYLLLPYRSNVQAANQSTQVLGPWGGLSTPRAACTPKATPLHPSSSSSFTTLSSKKPAAGAWSAIAGGSNSSKAQVGVSNPRPNGGEANGGKSGGGGLKGASGMVSLKKAEKTEPVIDYFDMTD